MAIKGLSLETVEIKEDIKNREFFFYDNTFIIITPEGQKNQVCVFDDKITDEAREYANRCIPPVAYKTDKQKKYLSKVRRDYWLVLFNLSVWKYLENNNKVEYMKNPL